MINIDDYSDIINMPHHISLRHPQMKREARAAQFAPFAALTGHDTAIEEASRVTSDKPELSDNELERLNDDFRMICEGYDGKQEIIVKYFVPDMHKDGGSIEMHTGIIRRIDDNNKIIIFEDGKEILIEMITDISISELNLDNDL